MTGLPTLDEQRATQRPASGGGLASALADPEPDDVSDFELVADDAQAPASDEGASELRGRD